MSCSFHDAFGGSHLPAVTVGMAKVLVGAVKVETVGEFGDNFEPGHVQLQLLLVFRQVETGHFGHQWVLRDLGRGRYGHYQVLK